MIGDILQPTHLLFILVIALVVLGPKRLPEVGRSLGRGIRDFRTAISGDEHEPVDPVPAHPPDQVPAHSPAVHAHPPAESAPPSPGSTEHTS